LSGLHTWTPQTSSVVGWGLYCPGGAPSRSIEWISRDLCFSARNYLFNICGQRHKLRHYICSCWESSSFLYILATTMKAYNRSGSDDTGLRRTVEDLRCLWSSRWSLSLLRVAVRWCVVYCDICSVLEIRKLSLCQMFTFACQRSRTVGAYSVAFPSRTRPQEADLDIFKLAMLVSDCWLSTIRY
jgi:hypothetical protein